MKFVKYATVVALSSVVLASTVGGQVSAAETGSEPGYNRTMDSKSDVNFIPSNGKTKPIDPTDPGKTDPPTPKPPKPGTEGPLSIDYASDFSFGTQSITTETKTYLAKPQEYSDSPKLNPTYVQVTDVRGTNSGWSLNLKQSHQFKSVGSQNEYIIGAQLKFKQGSAVTDGTAKAPSTFEATLDPTSGSYSKIMTAKATEGTGTWVALFGGKDGLVDTDVLDSNGKTVTEKRDAGVTLTIPGTTQTDAVEYSTTLNWQLTNEPGN